MLVNCSQLVLILCREANATISTLLTLKSRLAAVLGGESMPLHVRLEEVRRIRAAISLSILLGYGLK